MKSELGRRRRSGRRIATPPTRQAVRRRTRLPTARLGLPRLGRQRRRCGRGLFGLRRARGPSLAPGRRRHGRHIGRRHLARVVGRGRGRELRGRVLVVVLVDRRLRLPYRLDDRRDRPRSLDRAFDPRLGALGRRVALRRHFRLAPRRLGAQTTSARRRIVRRPVRQVLRKVPRRRRRAAALAVRARRLVQVHLKVLQLLRRRRSGRAKTAVRSGGREVRERLRAGRFAGRRFAVCSVSVAWRDVHALTGAGASSEPSPDRMYARSRRSASGGARYAGSDGPATGPSSPSNVERCTDAVRPCP